MTNAQRERINACITRLRTIKTERAEAITARDAAERAKQNIEAAFGQLENRFAALSGATYWSEMELNADVAKGARVRHLTHWYVCITPHTKSLLRSPLNATYWKLDDDE